MMNNPHSALIGIAKRRHNRTLKCVAGKPEDDRICGTCGTDHDLRRDFRNTKISSSQILRAKSDVIS